MIEVKTRCLAVGAMSTTLTVTMFFTTAFTTPVEFTDVPNSHWASSSITGMAGRGIMFGIGNNLSAPDQQLSSTEFIAMLTRQFYSGKLGAEGSTQYASFMIATKSANILTSTNAGSNKSLTTSIINRYNMAQLIYNVLKAKGITTSSLSDISKVADWASVPSTYRNTVSVRYNMGMLSGTGGKGTFDGTGVTNRAQAAVVMDHLLDACSGGTPSIPEKSDGSTSITKLDQIAGGYDAVEVNGSFFFGSSRVAIERSGLNLKASGYNSIMFMVKVLDVSVQVSVSHTREGASIADPTRTYREVLGIVPADPSKLFTIDYNANESIGIIAVDNNRTGVLDESSNILVKCYLLDLAIS